MAVVAASTATHFTYNGKLYPIGWEVIAHETAHANLKRSDYRLLFVSGSSTVGGVVPANQAALVAALETIVDGPDDGGGSSAEDINEALKATAQPVTLATASAQYPSGSDVSLPLTVTLTSGTEQEVILYGVMLPRAITILPVSGDTVRVRFRYVASGDWLQPAEALAVTYTSADDDKQHSLDLPVYSMGITRTAGAGTTSKVVVS